MINRQPHQQVAVTECKRVTDAEESQNTMGQIHPLESMAYKAVGDELKCYFFVTLGMLKILRWRDDMISEKAFFKVDI